MIPIPGDPLRARFSGPYVVHKKLNDVDYIIKMPEDVNSKGCVMCEHVEALS